ncbi:T9SS type A sorting domain-containing protein [Dyadobacter sp. NIV53]|uniref:T9SS type A sorting domain-containing protein n=1 Tax=Dyadobacter sp. NIV53 TaxID=2861765 RepID=UPI001C88AC4A|nr:T9SS type A sorting domain-containing protein [Dyadobacter sp. NIV53]
MKKLYIFILITITSSFALAQTQAVIYDYDTAGNRVLRKPSTPLPVALISFTAVKQGEDQETGIALLSWCTSSEINADLFRIERSENAKKWLEIGEVTANGDKTTESHYSFTDAVPLTGMNYYRLKMIDKDGSFAFSQIRNLDFGSQISFYPNPVNDRLKIKGIVKESPGNKKVQVFDVAGKVVFESTSFPMEGIDMKNFSSGIYLIKVSHQNGYQTIKKIVKE